MNGHNETPCYVQIIDTTFIEPSTARPTVLTILVSFFQGLVSDQQFKHIFDIQVVSSYKASPYLSSVGTLSLLQKLHPRPRLPTLPT